MKFFSLIKEAWKDYDNSRKIKDISDISIKVSTNHVYRIILFDGSKIIAKISDYGYISNFSEDHSIINALSILKRNNCKESLNMVRDCRDMLGANGLIEDYHIMRHLVNLETVKTYEGAENIHSLILGKNQTGIASF